MLLSLSATYPVSAVDPSIRRKLLVAFVSTRVLTTAGCSKISFPDEKENPALFPTVYTDTSAGI